MKSAGQSLIFLLVLLPVLIGLVGLLFRAGTLMLRHDQIENHCHKKVLDALALEGHGLSALGALNAEARGVIEARRWVDGLILATLPAVAVEPELLAAQRALKTMQSTIATTQKTLIQKTNAARAAVLFAQKTPQLFAGKITESYGPTQTTLSLKAETGFVGEVGAPLQPAADFEEREKTWGHLVILSEKFVWPWKENFAPNSNATFSPLFLNCQAQIKLTRLEAPWSVNLTPAPAVKRSWNVR